MLYKESKAMQAIRYIDQYQENCSTEDAIALLTGLAKPMWKPGVAGWEPLTEDGLISMLGCDEESWEALCQEYAITPEDVAQIRADFEEEAIASLEDDLEPEELAILTHPELQEMVTEEVDEKLNEWLEAFTSESLQIFAQEYSCKVEFWQNLHLPL